MKQRNPDGEARRLSALRAKNATPETREKHRKLWENPDFRKRVTEAIRNRGPISEETRKRKSASAKIASQRPEHIAKIQPIINNPEWRRRVGDAAKKDWLKPGQREKRIAAIKNAYKRPEVLDKVSGENSNFYRTGKGRTAYPKEFCPKLKEEIRRRDEYMCQMPDCYKTQSGATHPVHHIDHNRHNNDKSNLITLCVQCHVDTTLGDRDYLELLLRELQIQRGLVGGSGY
jgi:hypothetical protein